MNKVYNLVQLITVMIIERNLIALGHYTRHIYNCTTYSLRQSNYEVHYILYRAPKIFKLFEAKVYVSQSCRFALTNLLLFKITCSCRSLNILLGL